LAEVQAANCLCFKLVCCNAHHLVALVHLQTFAGQLVTFPALPAKSQQLNSTNGKSQRVMEKVTVNGKSDMGRNIFDSCGKREKLD
jgi:hypothetical protein